MTDSSTKITNKIEIREDITPPNMYNVIFMNDNVTTADFVIVALMTIFGYEEGSAVDLMQKIHNEGSAVVAIFPYELAEQKALETTLLARNNNFPLMVKIEANS